MSSINWTNSLNYASEFYIGLYDSAGNAWSHGPLHSGGGGTIGCLAGNATLRYGDQIGAILIPDTIYFRSGLVEPAVAIGAGVGGLVIGSLIGVAIAFLLIRRYYEKKMQADLASSSHGSPGVTTYSTLPQDFQYRSIPTSGKSHPTHASGSSGGLNQLRPGSVQYHIEPFVMPDENGRLADEVRSTGHTVTTPHDPVSSPSTAAPQQQSHVYVLHHDSNVPPVTIYHESGTEIVELPPRYPRDTSQSDMLSDGQTRTDLSSRSDGSRTGSSQPLAIHEPRQPAQLGKSARLP